MWARTTFVDHISSRFLVLATVATLCTARSLLLLQIFQRHNSEIWAILQRFWDSLKCLPNGYYSFNMFQMANKFRCKGVRDLFLRKRNQFVFGKEKIPPHVLRGGRELVTTSMGYWWMKWAQTLLEGPSWELRRDFQMALLHFNPEPKAICHTLSPFFTRPLASM